MNIPDGWFRLSMGTKVEEFDMYWSRFGWTNAGSMTGSIIFDTNTIWIRQRL